MPIRTNRGRVAVYRRLWGWPMRSPRHLVVTLLVIAAVVLFAGLIVPRITGSGDGPGGAAATLGGSGTTTSESGGPSGQSGAGSPPPAAGQQQPASTSSSLPTRQPPPSQLPATTPPEPRALEVATLWARAWVNHPQGITSEQWLGGLRPYTTEEYLTTKLSTVDPANIPATAVTGDATAATNYTSSVEVRVPTNGGTLSITVISTPQGWLVNLYDLAA